MPDQASPQGAFYIRLTGVKDLVVAKQPPGYSSSTFKATMPDGRQYDQPTVQTQTRSGAIDQLWTRQDGAGGAFRIMHVPTGLALRWNGRGAPLTLAPMQLNDSQQLWVFTKVRDTFGALYAANWNQAMNVLGYGPYDVYRGIGLWEYSGGQENELWELYAETAQVSVESIKYDMAKASLNLSLAPTVGVATAVDNRNGTITLSTNVEVGRTITTSKQFSYSDSSATTLKIARTFGIKGGIDKVVEISGSVAVENSTTTTVAFGETNAETKTISDKLTVSVQVPVGKRYQYAVTVSYGQVSVPYTATLARARPDNTIERSQVTGVYTGVSMVKYDIVGTDITDTALRPLQGPAPTIVREPELA